MRSIACWAWSAFALLTAAALLCTSAATALAQAVEIPAACTLSDVSRNGMEAENPRINVRGDRVWSERRPDFNGSDIFLFDAASGAVLNLSEVAGLYHSFDPQLNDRGDVAWVGAEVIGGVWNIWLYTAADGMVTRLTNAVGITYNIPQLANTGDVAWEGLSFTNSSTRDVFYYDAQTATITQLTDSMGGTRPVDYGNLRMNAQGDAVWVAWDGTNWEIFKYTAATATVAILSDSALKDDNPAISDNGDVFWVGWQIFSGAPNIAELYLHSAATGQVTQVTDYNAQPQHIVTNASGDAAWSGSDGTDLEIYRYLASDQSISQLTDNLAHDQEPFLNDAGDILFSSYNPGELPNVEVVFYEGTTGTFVQLTDNATQDNARTIGPGGEAVFWSLSEGRRTLTAYSTSRPAADAGGDISYHFPSVIVLDGSASCDPNGDELTYQWTLVSAPPGSTAELLDAQAPVAGLPVDVLGDYVVELQVFDGSDYSLPHRITVSHANIAPVADAGPDQVLTVVDTEVLLDASGTFDPDGDALTLEWSITARPAGSTAELDEPAAINPSFIADVNGRYLVRLVATDPFGQTAQDFVEVTFDNVAPVTDAGDNQAAVVGDTVVLDGTGSSDANGDPLRYFWALVSVPEGSVAWLADPYGPNPSFFADLPGTYVVSLLVDDNIVAGETDTVTIEVVATADGLTATLIQAIEVINGLPGEDFGHWKHRKHRHKRFSKRRLLTRQIGWALRTIDRGRYRWAEVLLEKSVLRHMDGCAERGRADWSDWIRTCSGQAQVYPLIVSALDYLGELRDPTAPPPEEEPPPPPPPLPPPGGGGGGI